MAQANEASANRTKAPASKAIFDGIPSAIVLKRKTSTCQVIGLTSATLRKNAGRGSIG